jgi:creatinine amidohydrolase
MAVYPQARDWDRARSDARWETDGYKDMHAGEMETSILLATHRGSLPEDLSSGRLSDHRQRGALSRSPCTPTSASSGPKWR